jgi:hypothetical protein
LIRPADEDQNGRWLPLDNENPMTLPRLLLSGLLGAMFGAALLATLPTFQPARQGWLSRFSRFLARYALPLAAMLVVISWFLVGR